MEGEERSGQKQIVHRMKLDAANSCDDEHQIEEKEQGHRREETDTSGKWSWLKFLRHYHSDLVSGQQIRVTPAKRPPILGFVLRCRGNRVIRKIHILEVCFHVEIEVSDLCDGGPAKTVTPLI